METRKTIASGLAMAVGATLLSAGVVLSPRDARAELNNVEQLKSKAQNLKNAASRLRDLASQKASSDVYAKEGQYDWIAQTRWLQDAASRSDAMAKKLEDAAIWDAKTAQDMKQYDIYFANLRKALLSESARNARQATNEVKARQDKAAAAIQALK